jgi:putative membrane protein
MTQTQGNLASLSRFIFRAPNWYSSLGFSLLIAALAGVAAFDSGQYVWQDAWEGVFFIGVPTVVASAGSTAIDRSLGGHLTPNRSSLLALASEFVLVGVMLLAALFASVARYTDLMTPLGREFVFDALIMGLAIIFAFRLVVIMGVSSNDAWAAAVPASLQTVSAAVLLFVYSGTLRYVQVRRLQGPLVDAFLSRAEEAPPELSVVTPEDFVLLAVLCALYGVGAWAFLMVMDLPWRRTLGVSVLDFARGFVGHVAEGTDELEEFFEDIGESAVVPVTVLSVRVPDGPEKARFVLPMIHPGPMGEIGGGNLPVRVAETADGVAFPPHATAGHDFNLVTEREVERLIDAADRAYQRIEYGREATTGLRVEDGEATVLGQAFGDDLMLVNTFAPGYADDVDFGVGLSAMSEARAGGADDVLLVDAHNCNNGLEGDDLGHVVPGSGRSFDLLTAAGEAARRLSAAPRGDLRMGVARTETDWAPEDGVGPLGVRVAVADVEGDRTGYVLVDGNNMDPGLRAHLLDAVDGVDRMEVMTSDTHIVNTVEAENQVGEAVDWDELAAVVQAQVDAAIEDLEPVEAGMASERAEVTVFGNDRTETLASHANAMISMGAPMAGAAIVVAVALSVLLFFLT